MKKYFFLPNVIILALLFVLLLFAFFIPIFFLLSFLLAAPLLFFYRRKFYRHQDFVYQGEGVVFAPCDGEITLIDICEASGQVSFTIHKSFYHEFGIYLPWKGDMLEDQQEGSGRERRLIFGQNFLSLNNEENHLLEMIVTPKWKCCSLDSWVVPGDLGNVGSTIALLPFGGSIKLTYRGPHRLLVKTGQKIEAAKTMLFGEI